MRRDDLYPSRTGAEPCILPRKDPVVHALRRDRGPFSEDTLADYERDGYLALEGVVPDDELGGLLEGLEELLADGADAPWVIREPDGGAVRSIFAVHERHPLFARLARSPRLLAMAEQLLGGPVYVHQSRVNFKPGFDGREFAWHSDFETWHTEDGMPRMRALSLSINLLENNELNGPLMVVPGSHTAYVTCPGRTPERHFERSLRRQEYGVPTRAHLEELMRQGGIVAPTGGPGSAVLFDCNAMHGSGGNITPWARSNFFLVYNAVENALVEPFCGLAPRPDFVASHDFTPLAPLAPSGSSGPAGPD